jgi:hypothetical protein
MAIEFDIPSPGAIVRAGEPSPGHFGPAVVTLAVSGAALALRLAA